MQEQLVEGRTPTHHRLQGAERRARERQAKDPLMTPLGCRVRDMLQG